MSQYHSVNGDPQVGSTPSSARTPSFHAPPQTNTEYALSPHLSAIPDEDGNTKGAHSAPKSYAKPFVKARLRLDAFLGEWLSPDYYDSITPPPDSVLMIASAKADLLRRGEGIDTPEDSSQIESSRGNFPGGWGSKPPDKESESLAPDFFKLSFNPQRRDRASTQGYTRSPRSRSPFDENGPDPPRALGYQPPTPRYAISPLDPIPVGYVAHAREACVEVDYQWDSMRAPQDWGNGGEYGEEWSSMHKRFRKGLQKMISWYRIHRESAHQAGGHQRLLHPHNEEDDDENTDTVLVLVTHGAGCNALIGALTNQPVLLDVGMASLTMAVHKDDEPTTNGNLSPLSPARHHIDRPLSTEYSVLLKASTEHLRTGANPLTIPLLQQPRNAATFPHSLPSTLNSSTHAQSYRYRLGSASLITSSPIDSPLDTPFTLPEASLGGYDRSPGLQRSASSAMVRSGSGLWSKPGTEASPVIDPLSGETASMQGNLDPKEIEREDDEFDESRHWSDADQVPMLGLWGANGGEEVRERERGLKRRWTVHDKS